MIAQALRHTNERQQSEGLASSTHTEAVHRHHFAVNPSRGLSNLLHRHEDASIVAARERVLNAEAREKDADRALNQARIAVREAREHVRKIELEAAEEARLARIKQDQAKDLGKRGKMLGRHDHVI
ncbi:hypothetical protein HYFRA_00002707 [Hymenoscyphus fraxineus]|uniref:Uncharacterized protein n=1 Tax=Hymenoscyphus fraxineus TaxID=746836 RepID=A0A9N9L8R4_9HELO|nr:hypothetical protein HYFRA_00002707 [Hymenoscyphus fraxineus]